MKIDMEMVLGMNSILYSYVKTKVATIDTAIALALQQFKVDRLKAEQKSNFTSSSVRRGLCSCATDRIWETGVIYPELPSSWKR
jgi:hypothetical protein